jgi:hypothetical protein
MDDTERQRSNPLWLVVLLALAGVVSLQGGAPRRPESSAQAAAGTSTLQTDELEHLEVSEEVRRLVQSGYALRPVVALVPHPKRGETQVGWLFDPYVDAIQRAAGAARFLLYRRALPRTWTELPREGDEANQVLRQYLKLLRQPERPPWREPGMLVFRHQWTKELLIVLLVGESPTRGVETQEFRRAFDWLWHFDRNWHDAGEIRILGPTFSGSAWSLGEAIDMLRAAQPVTRSVLFRIVSGTATGFGVGRALEQCDERPALGTATEFGVGKSLEECKKLSVSFDTTVIPDAHLLPVLYKYLENRGADLSKVALLVESTTGYGYGLFLSRTGSAGDDQPSKMPRLAFQFPLHVAQARVAYERSRVGRERPSAVVLDSRITQLELSLDESTRPADVVPPLEPHMTSFEVDLVLANTLATMAREDVRYVLIAATDTRDKLFLARKVREHLPDVQLLTTEGSLLYTHRDYRSYLDGMVVATTYPLFAKNQLWVTPPGVERMLNRNQTTRIVQFPDAGTQGVYNATLALLRRASFMKDYGMPCFYGPCPAEQGGRPPVWITAVGHGAMWPLEVSPPVVPPAGAAAHSGSSPGAVLDELRPEYEMVGPARPWSLPARPWQLNDRRDSAPDSGNADLAARLSYSRSAACLFYLFNLIAAAQGWMVLHLWRTDGRRRPAGAWRLIEPFRPPQTPDNARTGWLLLLLVVVAAVELMLMALYAIFVFTNWRTEGLTTGAFVPILLGAAALLVPCLLVVAAIWRVGGRYLGPVIVAAVLGAAVACLAVTLPPTHTTVFFYVRASNLGSGLSPLTPLLCLAVALYLWCLHHLRRVHLVDLLNVPNPLADEHVACSRLLRGTENVMRALTASGLRAVPPQVAFPTVALSMLSGTWLWRNLLPSYEGTWYDLVFYAAFMVAYLAVLAACLRFVFMWMGVRTLLRQLDAHPLTAGFSRLPQEMRQALRQRYYAYVPGASHRRLATRVWLRIGGGTDWTPAVQSDDCPLGSTSPAAVAHDSAAFYEVEATEWETAGRELIGAQSDVQRTLAQRAAELAGDIVPCDPQFESRRRVAPAFTRRLLDQAETFVAMQVVVSLGQKFVQLKNVISFAVAGMLLITLAFASYPFQPQRLLMMFNIVLATAVVLGLLIGLFQADRDPLLRRMAGLERGTITLDRGLLRNVAAYGVLPLLTVIATQFPEAGRALESLLTLLR